MYNAWTSSLTVSKWKSKTNFCTWHFAQMRRYTSGWKISTRARRSWVLANQPISCIKSTSDLTQYQEDSLFVLHLPVAYFTQGLPPQWSKLLTSSAITKEEAARHPEAVLDVLQFYTQQQMGQADYPSKVPSAPERTATSARRFEGTGFGGQAASPRDNSSTTPLNTRHLEPARDEV